MTIKTNFIPEKTLEHITSLAFRGYVDSALGALNKSELNEEQKQKIAAILQGPLPSYTKEGVQKLKERISAVINTDSTVLNDTSATAPGISSTSVTDVNELNSSSQITHIVPPEQAKAVSSINTSIKNLISKNRLPEVIVCLICKRSVDGAIYALNNSDLNGAQKERIKAILQEPFPGHAINFDIKDSERYQAAETLRQRIRAVINEDSIVLNNTAAKTPNINSTSVTDLSELGSVFSFSDTSASPFTMDHPCTFEFEGKQYQNATACFLAQQYTDQAEIMNLFTTLGSEEASALAELTPMTKERKLTWGNFKARYVNMEGVLIRVQRAKFGQNPQLRTQLLATGSSYLVCQGHGFYLTDNFNGAGENALGYCLMRLRGEYGGYNVVPPAASYLKTLTSQQEKNYKILCEIPEDIVGLLIGCIDLSDCKTLTAFPCLNKFWHKSAINFWQGLDLKQNCPELTILDAKAQEVNCDDEPKINNLTILRWVKELAPQVEANAGVTKLTMTKGTTLNQLIKIAADAGITVDVLSKTILTELGDVPVEQTYVILITNSVFNSSRKVDFNLQKTHVEKYGCEMPKVQEYLALCIFMKKVFKQYLYGTDPLTYGASSTWVDNKRVIIGNFRPDRISIFCNAYDDWITLADGAGGRRKIVYQLLEH